MTPRRAALLKCRTAERFANRTKPTPAEAREEQEATLCFVPGQLWRDLMAQGLVAWANGLRLTEKGRAEVQSPDPST